MSMRKFGIFISLFLTLSLVVPQNANAMSPKVKAFLLISGYGIAGGGLLGLSSMAFGEDSSAIFKGMSIGLYLGMAFGAYVVGSHKYKVYKSRNPDPQIPYYDDAVTPYGDDQGGYGGGFDGGGGGPSDAYEDAPQEQPQQRFIKLKLDVNLEDKFELKKDSRSLPLYLHLLDYRF